MNAINNHLEKKYIKERCPKGTILKLTDKAIEIAAMVASVVKEEFSNVELSEIEQWRIDQLIVRGLSHEMGLDIFQNVKYYPKGDIIHLPSNKREYNIPGQILFAAHRISRDIVKK